MQVHFTERVQQHLQDQVRTGRFASEAEAVRYAVARQLIEEHGVDLTPDEIAAAHGPDAPDHEQVAEQLLHKRDGR